jgi:hypothetical protein
MNLIRALDSKIARSQASHSFLLLCHVLNNLDLHHQLAQATVRQRKGGDQNEPIHAATYPPHIAWWVNLYAVLIWTVVRFSGMVLETDLHSERTTTGITNPNAIGITLQTNCRYCSRKAASSHPHPTLKYFLPNMLFQHSRSLFHPTINGRLYKISMSI